MTNILTFFSTRTLLQIVFVLGSAVALKAWSLGLLFGGLHRSPDEGSEIRDEVRAVPDLAALIRATHRDATAISGAATATGPDIPAPSLRSHPSPPASCLEYRSGRRRRAPA